MIAMMPEHSGCANLDCYPIPATSFASVIVPRPSGRRRSSGQGSPLWPRPGPSRQGGLHSIWTTPTVAFPKSQPAANGQAREPRLTGAMLGTIDQWRPEERANDGAQADRLRFARGPQCDVMATPRRLPDPNAIIISREATGLCASCCCACYCIQSSLNPFHML